jgi:DNA-binding HxlR family transcriptional regulator
VDEAYAPRSGCPINAAIEVFGDRWSLIVLRDMVFEDLRYFRELQANSIEGIAPDILADRLIDSSSRDCSFGRTRDPASERATA